mmetsp:Transcript_8826/g.9936  ORF Transcript_8826/g.9936 Transcript_8826/m.9936 type:complete len:220 (+) Transcript_8826:19-678(+)
MSQYSSSLQNHFYGVEGTLSQNKHMKISQSYEDFAQINFGSGLTLRKRVFSSDVLMLEGNPERNNAYFDSQAGDSTQMTCSSQKHQTKDKKKATREDFVSKFKTEMCKFWESKGSCPYGKRCAFAHGDLEKRYKGIQKERKVPVKCVNFHQHGYCSYGRRCQYIHFIPEVTFNKTSSCYQEKMNDITYLEPHENGCICSSRRRLDTFAMITSSPASASE